MGLSTNLSTNQIFPITQNYHCKFSYINELCFYTNLRSTNWISVKKHSVPQTANFNWNFSLIVHIIFLKVLSNNSRMQTEYAKLYCFKICLIILHLINNVHEKNWEKQQTNLQVEDVSIFCVREDLRQPGTLCLALAVGVAPWHCTGKNECACAGSV